jgi:1-acyl-sn-glycerol-3-phosphate acyltransferase
MNRILLMVMRNIPKVPGLYAKLCHYAKNTDKYSRQESWDHIRKILTIGVNSGNVDLKIFGVENIPEEDGMLFYGNHQGLFDCVALVAACEKPLSAVLKHEIKDIPFIKQVVACTVSYPMDRNDDRQSLKIMQNIAKDVASGSNFVIFPEGTRSREGNKMIEFHGGSFRPAIKAKCPVVPMVFIDTYKVFDSKSSDMVSCQLHFLPPVQPEEYEGMKAGELAELVKARIQETLDKYA